MEERNLAIIGKDRRDVLLTDVDRVSRLSKIKTLSYRKAELMAEESVELLRDHQILAITFDNRKMFSQHKKIAHKLDTTSILQGLFILVKERIIKKQSINTPVFFKLPLLR